MVNFHAFNQYGSNMIIKYTEFTHGKYKVNITGQTLVLTCLYLEVRPTLLNYKVCIWSFE